MNFLKRLFELLFKKKQPEETKNDFPILGDPVFIPSQPPPPLGASERWVEVRPTGVKGVGKVRLYPNPKFVLNYENKPVETIDGYAGQIQNTWGCKHFDFNTQGGRLRVMGWNPTSPEQYPEALDRISFAEEWKEQKELDMDEALRKRDTESAKGRDPFISASNANKPNDDEDIPISNG